MKPIPPWYKETKVFQQPGARCELVLDGQPYYASIAVWDGYCYFQVDSLSGLWAITRPYDNTDLTQFVTSHIEAGEVGKVYTFSHGFSNLDPVTQKYTASHREEPLTVLNLVAIIRFDNSALVRETRDSLFVETPPFDNGDRRKKRKLPQTKAYRPSLWHPSREMVGRKQIGRAARELVFQKIPEAELLRGKTGSISELIVLLEALWLCGSVSYRHGSGYWNTPDYYHFEWRHYDGRFSRNLNARIDIVPFLQILRDYYSFELESWIPAKHIGSSSITNKRYEWELATPNSTLKVRFRTAPTAHERLEAALLLENFFKGKVSDKQLEELLGEPPKPLYLT